MSGLSLISSFLRLSVSSSQCCSNYGRTISTYSSPLCFKISQALFAEPLKKKKRIDPAIIKAREERRKKKIEKQIRRLERNAKQLKPIDELEIPIYLIDNEKQHTRHLAPPSAQVLESRVLLEKAWAAYKRNQRLTDIQMIDRIVQCQQRALDELRKESEDLYQEAIQLDQNLLSFSCQGPVETPAMPNYESPDGDYVDVSKKWD